MGDNFNSYELFQKESGGQERGLLRESIIVHGVLRTGKVIEMASLSLQLLSSLFFLTTSWLAVLSYNVSAMRSFKVLVCTRTWVYCLSRPWVSHLIFLGSNYSENIFAPTLTWRSLVWLKWLSFLQTTHSLEIYYSTNAWPMKILNESKELWLFKRSTIDNEDVIYYGFKFLIGRWNLIDYLLNKISFDWCPLLQF